MATLRRMYGGLLVALLMVMMQFKDPLTLRAQWWSQVPYLSSQLPSAVHVPSKSSPSSEARAALALTRGPPKVKPTPRPVPVLKNCTSMCEYNGDTASCEARIQWAANNVYFDEQLPCTAAHKLVLEECPSCSDCKSERSGCKAPSQLPPSRIPCLTTCTLHQQPASCMDRIQWAATNVHGGSPDPCAAAHRMVLDECAVCASCLLGDASCKVAAAALAPTSLPLLKLRFNGTGLPGFGPWRMLGSFIKKRCFWKQSVWGQYVQMHRRILQGEAPPRYIIFQRDTMGQGLGATLRGMYLCFYLAMASGRALLIDWQTPVELDDVFDPVEVDWRWSKHKALISKIASSSKRRVNYVNMDQTALKMDSLWKTVSSSQVQAVFLETNMDANSWVQRLNFKALGDSKLTLRQLVPEDSRLAGCAFHSLFRFRGENSAFSKLWKRTDDTVPPGPRIGVHLRVGDVSWAKDSSDRRPVIFDKQWGLRKPEEAARQALECAQQTAKHVGLQSPCTIVFESDNDKSKRAARTAGAASGPCTCWTSSSSPTHERRTVDHQKTRESWVALVMLSSVEVLISSQSTFSSTAGSIGPGLVEPRRHINFEDALKRRAGRKRSRDDTKDLCHFE